MFPSGNPGIPFLKALLGRKEYMSPVEEETGHTNVAIVLMHFS